MTEEHQSPTLPAFNFHNRFDNTSSQGQGPSQDQHPSQDQTADTSFTFEFSNFGSLGANPKGGLGAFLGRPSDNNEGGRREAEPQSIPASAVQFSTPLEANTSIAETQKSERASPETWAPQSAESPMQGEAAPALDLDRSLYGASDSRQGPSAGSGVDPDRSTSHSHNASADMYSQPRQGDAQLHSEQTPVPSAHQSLDRQPQQLEGSELGLHTSPPQVPTSDTNPLPPESNQPSNAPDIEAMGSSPCALPLAQQEQGQQPQPESCAPLGQHGEQIEAESQAHQQATSSQQGVRGFPNAQDGQTDQYEEGKQVEEQTRNEDLILSGQFAGAAGALVSQPAQQTLPRETLADPSHLPIPDSQEQQHFTSRTSSPGQSSQQERPFAAPVPDKPHRNLPQPPSLLTPLPSLEFSTQERNEFPHQRNERDHHDSASSSSGEQKRRFTDTDNEGHLPMLSSSSTSNFANMFGESELDRPSLSLGLLEGSHQSREVVGRPTAHSNPGPSPADSQRSASDVIPTSNSSQSINFSRPSGPASQTLSSPSTSAVDVARLHNSYARPGSSDFNRHPAIEDAPFGGLPPLQNVALVHDPSDAHDSFLRHGIDRSGPRPWETDMRQRGQQQQLQDELVREQERPDNFFGMQSPVAAFDTSDRSMPLSSDCEQDNAMAREESNATSGITDDSAFDFFPNHPEADDDNDGFFQGGNDDSGSSAEQQVGLGGESQAARLAAAYHKRENLRSDSASTASAQNRSTLAGGTGNAYIQQSSSSSYRDSLMTGRPLTIAASPSGPLLDHSHLKPGQQAALLSHIKTLELYRLNAKKTNDPDLIYEFAVFMIDASKSMPDSPTGPPQTGSKEELIKEAIGLLKKIAERGQSDAQYFLADCYANGIGTPKGKQDFDRAYPLFVLAAKHGHPDAAYRAGTCYEKGWGCRRDNGKALQFYRKAAAQSHPGAMYRLATAELNGEMGLKRSAKEGVKWLKRSADSATPEFPHALHELALLHERGIDNVLFLDPEYACELLAQAGEMGYAPSAYKLGVNYEYGRMGCPQDAGLSIHMYNIAAQQNHKEACFALTAWYLVGAPGILPQSDTEAYLWAKKAAEQGLAKAEYAVGYFTEMGIGTVRDRKEAKAWFTRAAEHGDHRANQRLTNLGAPTVKMLKGVGTNENGNSKGNHQAGQHGLGDATDYASLPNSRRTQPINAPFPSRIENSSMSPAGAGATTYPSPVTMRDQQSLQRESKYLANVAAYQQVQVRAAAAASRSATSPTEPTMSRSEPLSHLTQGGMINGAGGVSSSTNGGVYPSFSQRVNHIPLQQASQPQPQPQPPSRLPPLGTGQPFRPYMQPLPAPTPTRFNGPPPLPSINTSGIQQYVATTAPSEGGTAGNGGGFLPSSMSTASPAYPSYPARGLNHTSGRNENKATPPPRADSGNGSPFQSGPPQQPNLQMLRQSNPQGPQQQSRTPPPTSPQHSRQSSFARQRPQGTPPTSPLAQREAYPLPHLQNLMQLSPGRQENSSTPSPVSSLGPPQLTQLQISRQSLPAPLKLQSPPAPSTPRGDAPQLPPFGLSNRSPGTPPSGSPHRGPSESLHLQNSQLPPLPISREPFLGPQQTEEQDWYAGSQPASSVQGALPQTEKGGAQRQSSPAPQRLQNSPPPVAASQASPSGGRDSQQLQIQSLQGSQPAPYQQQGTPPQSPNRGGPPQQSHSGAPQVPSPERLQTEQSIANPPQWQHPGQQGPFPHPQQRPPPLNQQGRPGPPFPPLQQRPPPFQQQPGQQGPFPETQQRPPPFHQQGRPGDPFPQGPFPRPPQQGQPPFHQQGQQGPFSQRPPPGQQRTFPQQRPGQQGPSGPPFHMQDQQRPIQQPSHFRPQHQGGNGSLTQGPGPTPFSWQHQRPYHEWIPSSQSRGGGPPPGGAASAAGSSQEQHQWSNQGETSLMTQGMLGLDSDAKIQAQIAQRAKILEQRQLATASQAQQPQVGANGDAQQKKKKKGWFK